MLTIHREFAKRAYVNRLSVGRVFGGRGLISVEDCIKLEELSVDLYRLEFGFTINQCADIQ